MDERLARHRYEQLVAAVKAAIDAPDPVDTIAPRVARAADAAEVRKIILEEFERWFGPEMARPAADPEASARTIWQAVLKFRS